MKKEGLLSIILPAFNEEKIIKKAANVIGSILNGASIPYEIIFVDDGSKDDTWNQIEAVSKEDEHIVGIHFSRNFGKESALLLMLMATVVQLWIVIYSIHQRF